MSKKAVLDRSARKPDWVDILLAATLAAWGTVLGSMFVFWFLPVAFETPLDAVPSLFNLLLFFGFFGFILATAVCTIVGLPALALARWLNLTEWWQAAAVGSIAGILVVGTPILSLPGEIVSKVVLVVTLVIAGALAGVAAWRERERGDDGS